jgi:hypothetical protein
MKYLFFISHQQNPIFFAALIASCLVSLLKRRCLSSFCRKLCSTETVFCRKLCSAESVFWRKLFYRNCVLQEIVLQKLCSEGNCSTETVFCRNCSTETVFCRKLCAVETTSVLRSWPRLVFRLRVLITKTRAKIIATLTVLFLYQTPMRGEQDGFFELVRKI